MGPERNLKKKSNKRVKHTWKPRLKKNKSKHRKTHCYKNAGKKKSRTLTNNGNVWCSCQHLWPASTSFCLSSSPSEVQCPLAKTILENLENLILYIPCITFNNSCLHTLHTKHTCILLLYRALHHITRHYIAETNAILCIEANVQADIHTCIHTCREIKLRGVR